MTAGPGRHGETDKNLRFHLTSRETAILCLVAGGLTTVEVARSLHISRHTVAQHIADMLHRNRASTRGELIARAYAAGVLATGTWPPQAENSTVA